MTDKRTPAQLIDAGKTMAEMWEGFAGLVLTDVAVGSLQYVEMRKAFYSGAFSLFRWFMVQMDEGEEPTDDDVGRVARMDEELEVAMMSFALAGRH